MSVDWSILSNPIVVSVVGGFVGWLLSQFTNKKRMEHEKEINDMKLKADVVVKSRMEWIKEVRELSSRLLKVYTKMYQDNKRFNIYENKISDYIQEINKLSNEVIQMDNKKKLSIRRRQMDNKKKISIMQRQIERRNEKLKDLKIEFEEIGNRLPEYVGQFSEIKFLFKSYFLEKNIDGTTNEQNSELIEAMEKCIALLNNYCTSTEEVSIDELQQSLDNFTYKLSKYLKEEWEKVKRIE